MSRRDFFTQAADRVTGEISSRLKIFGVEMPAQKETASSSVQKDMPLIRSLEPMTRDGLPFGGPISGFCIVPAMRNRVTAVFGHAAVFSIADGLVSEEVRAKLQAQSLGLSAIEIARADETSPWRARFSSAATKRLLPGERSALAGGRMLGGKLERHEEAHPGPGAIRAITATPWGTVLFSDDSGWIGEYSPLSTLLTYRFALGRVWASSIRVEAEAGKPVRVILKSVNGSEFRFSSHQLFEARLTNLNQSILAVGDLDGIDAPEFLDWVAMLSTLVPVESAPPIEIPEVLRCQFDGLVLRSEKNAVTFRAI